MRIFIVVLARTRKKVFLRLPQLLDSILYYTKGRLEDRIALAISLPNDEAKPLLYNAVVQCKSVYYLIAKTHYARN
jgi:hypothetical protein